MKKIKCITIVRPDQVEIREIEMPVPKKGEALLKLLYGGICGSDLNTYKGISPYVTYPRIPGHEFSAEIIQIEENNLGLKEGMIVTANPYFNCQSCYSCERGFVNCCTSNQTMGVQREGAFAEYITMPIERIYEAKTLSPKTLCLIEPFCIGYHGVKRAEVAKNDTVLILGAGTIGVLAMKAAKLKGARVYISDIAQGKLDHAIKLGADGVILNDSEENFAKQVSAITNGNGFDVTIEAVGLASTFKNCIDAAAFRGRVVLIGVSKQLLDFAFTIIQTKELTIYGSRNASKNDFLELIEIVAEGNSNLDSVISKSFKYEDAAEAFEFFKNNIATNLKIILEF